MAVVNSWLLSKLFKLIKETFPSENNFHAECDPLKNQIIFSYLGYRYMIALSKIDE